MPPRSEDSGSSNVAIRPSNPEDAFAIAKLLAAAGLHPDIGERDLHWKYWRARSDRPAPRSFVFLQGGEIVAHAGVVEGNWLGQNVEAHTVHLVDWAARPNAAGAGVALMKYIANKFEATLLAIGGSLHTMRLLPHLGFRPVGGAMRYALPLRPGRILHASAIPRWKRFGRVARAYWWSMNLRHSEYGGNTSVTRVAPGTVSTMVRSLPGPTQGSSIFSRSGALLEHALNCPTTPTELFCCHTSSSKQGYFLLTFAPEQARLADYWIASDNPEDWHSLVRAAIRQAKEHPVAELATWASDASTARLCTEEGFRARGALTVQALQRTNRPLPAGPMRVHMLDNDSAFSHHGHPELWL